MTRGLAESIELCDSLPRMPSIGLVLGADSARFRRDAIPPVDFVLLERTFYDPPRAAAAKRWQAQIRRVFPESELIPYVWHLVSHGVEDRIREHTSRTLPGIPHRFGHLQATEETAAAWEAASPCYQALEARRLCLRTPAGVSPGALGRKRLRAFVEARREEGYTVIWEPDGLWEAPLAAQFAGELDCRLMMPCFTSGRPLRDPEEDGLLVGANVWLRADGMPRRPALSEDQLDALLEHIEVDPTATIVFSGPRAVQNARTFCTQAR